MTTVSTVAVMWQQAGVSVVPVLANATKRPAVQWAAYQVEPPTLNQVSEWWGNGRQYGLALICGKVSGALEMTEIEGRACSGESLTRIQLQMEALGIADVWATLNGPSGYSEMSPAGGLHLLYRISDHEVPGNTKIARRRATAEELGKKPLDKVKVLAETRGEGGYVIVAPSPGQCHPSGEAWMLLMGAYGRLPVITWEQRCKIHEGLRLALDEPVQVLTEPHRDEPDYSAHVQLISQSDYPPPGRAQPSPTNTDVARPPATSSTPDPLSPADHFEMVVDWDDILIPHGWQSAGSKGQERLWTRPGKDPRDGWSATTGYADDRNRLYVFSTSTEFDSEVPYTKFGAYAVLNHGGNHHLAARALAVRYGIRVMPKELDTIPRPKSTVEDPGYTRSDDGNSRYLMDRVQGRFIYLDEDKTFLMWDGKRWCRDKGGALAYEFRTMAQEKLTEAEGRGDEAGAKWWLRSLNVPKVKAALEAIKELPGFTVSYEDLDHDVCLINTQSGVYDLERHVLRPHDPRLMMTKLLGTEVDPEATCPQFEGFMERVLPDPDMRSYVQRALGYSLLGDADQRSLFLMCGPSGTGKSTLMTTMELLFRDYGATAPPGTFRAKGRESSSPSNDLHKLMGRRFVSTSETNEHTAYDEDLIKRLTGRDTISSRRLYSEFVEWVPRCSIWLATNHPPRFTSDDDAIWRRAKIVPFNTVLVDDPDHIPDFAHKILSTELAGIFNWLLAGLKAYQADGLGEPEPVKQMASDTRLQSDPVARFLEDRITDGILLRGDGNQIRFTELYTMYTEWARQVGERGLGSRRFSNRVGSTFSELELTKIQGHYVWRGLGRATNIRVQEWLVAGASSA